MKDLKNFIVESNINKGIDELASLLKKTVLKDVKLSEDDFEESENDGTFNLCNVPQDSKLADDFFNGRAGINSTIHTVDSPSQKEISLVQAGKDDIFVRINLDTENGEGYKKGDILSIDMSKEIKDKLI